jgi:hypothetical protein
MGHVLLAYEPPQVGFGEPCRAERAKLDREVPYFSPGILGVLMSQKKLIQARLKVVR